MTSIHLSVLAAWVGHATSAQYCADETALLQGHMTMQESVRRRDNSDLEVDSMSIPENEPCDSRPEPAESPQLGRDFHFLVSGQKCPHRHSDRLFRIPETGSNDPSFPVEDCYSFCAETANCNYFSYGDHNGGKVCMGCSSLEHAQIHDGFDVYDMVFDPEAPTEEPDCEPQTKGNNGNGITSSGGPDGASAIQFIDLGAGAFEHAGEMRSVRYHVSRANQAAQKFQIYRLVSGNTYHLVSETEALASTQAGSIVTQEFQTPLQFQEGDFIGWVHTGRGTFPFRGGGGSVRWRYGIQGVGSDINFNGRGARIYAYEVAYTACSAPVIIFDQASPSLTVTPGTLSGTGQLNWNTAANSALQVSQGDNICGISFKCNSAESHLMIGLAHTEVTRWRDIDYGVTCRGAWSTNTDIYENRVRRNSLSNRNSNGSPASDVHAIRVNRKGQVEYSVNGDVYFISSRPVTYPWHVGVDTYTSPSLADAEYLSCDA